MHEHALMADLFRKLAEIAAAEEAERIVRVVVSLGALSHMTPEHFKAHFLEGTLGGPAQDAELDIRVGVDIHAADAREVRLVAVEVEG